MRKVAEIENPNSCLNRAGADEPLFVLRSTDELASSIVRTWAIMYFKQKSAHAMGMTPKQRAKYEEAMALAAQMDVWLRKHKEVEGEARAWPYEQMAHDHAKPRPPGDTPLDAKAVAERLCRLQAEVYQHLPGIEAADCFCGKGGFWNVDDYDGTWDHGYRNDGHALKFIEDAVREKIGQSAGMTAEEIDAANNSPLCDRLEAINVLADKALRNQFDAQAMAAALVEISEKSGGFMKVPK